MIMGDTEDALRRTLQASGAAVVAPEAPVGATLAAGRAGRHRRAWVAAGAAAAAVAVVVAGAAAVVGGGGDPMPVPPAASPSTGDTSPSTSPVGPSLGEVTRCAELPRMPDDTEIDTTLAYDLRQLMLAYTDPGTGAQRSFVVDFGDDDSCRQRSDVARVIDDALTAAGHPPL
jgi:hypothetical protein